MSSPEQIAVWKFELYDRQARVVNHQRRIAELIEFLRVGGRGEHGQER